MPIVVPLTRTFEVGTNADPVTVIAVSGEPEAMTEGDTELMVGGIGVEAGVGVGTKELLLPPQPAAIRQIVNDPSQNKTGLDLISTSKFIRVTQPYI